PLAVDSSQTVIFPALVTGGCVHVISETRAIDPQALRDYFGRHRIDLLKIAPSHLAALHAAEQQPVLMPERRLIIGGEASRWEWVGQLLHACPPGCTIYNHYGPTEATVGMLTYRISAESHGRQG